MAENQNTEKGSANDPADQYDLPPSVAPDSLDSRVRAHRPGPPPPTVPPPPSSSSPGDQDASASEGGKEVTKKKRKWPKRVALGIVAAIAALTIVGVGAFFWAYSRIQIPEPSEFALSQTTIVYYNDGETELGRFSEVNRTVIDTSEIPEYVGLAVVASEDRTFFTNPGVDFRGIIRAFVNNISGGDRQGASTLSEQFVENYFIGSPTSSYRDRMRESLIALKMNRTQTKEEILNNYLNTVYFGRNAYGIEAASFAYFDKPASELTLSEAAMLAGILPSPNAWDPEANEAMAQERWGRVLELMVEDGYITAELADQQEFPAVIPPGSGPNHALSGWKGYLLQQVQDELTGSEAFTEEEVNTGGLRVISTLDVDMQDAALEAVQILPEDTPDSVRVALSSIDNATGEIVAEYAGDDYQKVWTNSVTYERAMAGSTLKQFALIPYVERGNSIWQTFDGNSPQTFAGISVQNVDNTSFGYVTAVEATAVSANTAFVSLNEIIGPQTFMDTIIEAGIPADTPGLEPGLINILGSASPRNIDLTHAFATLANGGEKVEPHIVRSVADPNGNQLYQTPTPRERVFDSATLSQIMPALQAPTTWGGTAERVAELGRPVGGKTGTSEETKSATFAGFIPQYTTTVSMFNMGENNEMLPLPSIGYVYSVHGGDWPVDIWMAYMNRALVDVPIEDFSWYDPWASESEPVQIPQGPTSETSTEPEETVVVPEEDGGGTGPTETPTDGEDQGEPTEPTDPVEPPTTDGGDEDNSPETVENP